MQVSALLNGQWIGHYEGSNQGLLVVDLESIRNSATRLSFAACSRIRAGVRAPHPRHWEALLALAEAGN